VRWDFGYCGHYWPIVSVPDDRWWWLWRNWWNEDWQGKLKYSEKTCPSATLSTTNPTWLDPGLNPDRRGGKPATNRLSYGAASTKSKLCYDRRSVGQSVFVSSTNFVFLSDICRFVGVESPFWREDGSFFYSVQLHFTCYYMNVYTWCIEWLGY
jgi:hypothetical protein